MVRRSTTTFLCTSLRAPSDPWIDYNDGNYEVLATNVGTQQLTGYLVLDADVNSDANTFNLFADPNIIFYGGTGSNKWGVSVDLTGIGGMDTCLFSLQGKTDKGLLFWYGWGTEQERVGNSEGGLYGKTVKQDIGKGAAHKQGVPSSMKGYVEEYANGIDFFEAYGNTTATLNSIYTKWANSQGKTQEQTADKIIEDLGNLGYPFKGAIQARIDAAIANRDACYPGLYPPVTVTVPPGTYNEDLYIYEPNVKLQSASGKANTIIQLQTGGYGIWLDYSGNNSGCTIGGSLGHGFTIKSGTGTGYMIYINSNNTEVSYCDINSVGNADRGVKIVSNPGDISGVTVKNNNFFTDNDDSGVYLRGDNHMKNVNISNNNFFGDDTICVTLKAINGNGITVTGNTTNCDMDIQIGEDSLVLQNLTISNNIFNHGSGIYVSQYDSGDPCRVKDVNISNNTFAAGSNKSALIIWDSLAPSDVNWATFTFTHNKILRTPGGANYTVDNGAGASGAVLKADYNYWGTANGPTNGCDCGLGASISDKTYVDFENFYTTAAMTTDSNCAKICP